MSELFVITTYFNPVGYASRRRNYDLFMTGMRAARVPCLTVECAFGEEDFDLPPSLDVIQVRAGALLWQKERLLNLAASWLPDSCRYVAWIDCDILFDNLGWPADLVRVLQSHRVAQVFETCTRLNRDGEAGETPDVCRSFASVVTSDRATLDAGRYDLHGHTGYGWAMHREIFDQVGLYECAISGSADHFMAHAIFGDYNFCIRNALKHDRRQIGHLREWGERFHALVRGSLGVTPGHVRHLWHGDAINRRYFLRMHDITDLGFDPWTDLEIRPGQPIEWAAGMGKTGLRDYFARYFSSRMEDGMELAT
ncbi:MAG: hypothetical protein GAK35_00472 [Herbaspirillum frisingense]|uniref:Glycosyltransferase family 2 protein n=1 Tax=Herbaspirillum frisingense TaxID=92645 RepID=A0A7V8FZT6_9BURK|nr:MAG: hypothetical protein GAK35_00472 [Herbaspirillum frisingense]